MKQLLATCLLILMACSSSDEVTRLKKLNDELNDKLNEANTRLNDANADVNKINFLKRSLSGIKVRFITDLGTMEAQLYSQQAPLHVALFVARAESGFYNGLQFHRVIPGFMIQGGDPNSRDNNFSDDGMGGPVFMTPHEFNETKHVKGTLSTARVGDKSVGAGSQFFIMHDNAPHLDNEYTVFGKVYNGLEVIDKIVNVERDPQTNHPKKAVRIQRIEVFR